MNQVIAISILAIIVYFLGVFYAYGRNGGICDGADGIGDMLFVFGWPVVFLVWLVLTPFNAARKLGEKRSKDSTE